LNRSSWLNLAAAAAALSALSITAILVPSELRTPAVLCSAVLLACATGLLLLWPRIGSRDSQGVRLAMLGSMGILSVILLAGAGAALLAALTGHDRLSFALILLVLGAFVVGVALGRTGAHTIARHTQLADTPSMHGQWQSQVGQLVQSCADDQARGTVSRLAESLRYAASDKPGYVSAENARIGSSIMELERAVRDNELPAVLAAVGAIQAALAVRELDLKAQRGKA